MPGTQTGARLGDCAFEAGSGAGIDDLGRGAIDERLHIAGVAHEPGIEDRGKMAWGTLSRFASLERPAFGLPFPESSVQVPKLFVTPDQDHTHNARRRVEQSDRV